jgi:hypothetical protein
VSTETRELLIRTGFEWRVQRIREKLRDLYFVIKRKLTGEKPFVWDEESMKAADALDDEEYMDEDPYAFTGPDFNPAVTALFSTDYKQPLRHISRRVIRMTRQKVSMDCRTLVDQGYTNFIVNNGDTYGMIALSELIHLKKILFPQIDLYCGKLWGEHSHCHTSGDIMEVLMTCIDNGAQLVGSMQPETFAEKVVRRASQLSFERGLMEMDKTMPKSMLTHFVLRIINRYWEADFSEDDADSELVCAGSPQNKRLLNR